MHAFLIFQFFLCVFLAVLAGLLWIRDPNKRMHQLAACLIAGGAFWSGGEVVWNFNVHEEAALTVVRVAALGWLAAGPLVVHLALGASGATLRRRRMVLSSLYAISGLFALMALTTPWLYSGMQREVWGWSYRLGAGFLFVLGFTLACGGAALYTLSREQRGAIAVPERRRLRAVAAALTVSALAVSIVDGILPYLGVSWWRTSGFFYAALGVSLTWEFYHREHSLIAPGNFVEAILENIPCGVALLRVDGQLRFANRAFEKLFACESGELVGVHVEEIFPPADLAASVMFDRHETVCASRDGAAVPVAVSGVLLRNPLGLPLGRLLIAEDLREVDVLRSQLVAADRWAAVGELASGIAHELNNPLAFVRSNLQLLRDHWREMGTALLQTVQRERMVPILEEGFDMIDESLEGLVRTAKITREFQEFAQIGKGARELVDVNALLDQVLRIAEAKLASGAVIEKKHEPAPLVFCDPQEIKQVFLNLLLNAVRAIDDSGRITLTTTLDEEWVVVTVEDDGCGIDPATIEQIFDPFFTTKPGEAVGLGLTIAHRIVSAHGGDLCVESKSGEHGTRFIVLLPAAGQVVMV